MQVVVLSARTGWQTDELCRALGERGDGLDVLARQNFRRRHQGGLFAGLGHGGRSQQRHHRLARSDIALQQPQHPDRLAQILDDGGNRLALRARQRIGQRVDDPVAQMAVAIDRLQGPAAPGAGARHEAGVRRRSSIP